MFSKHVTQFLSAYCQNELGVSERFQVGQHLQICGRCRREMEEIRNGILWAKHLSVVPAPPSLWPTIQKKLTGSTTAPLMNTWWKLWVAATSVAVIVISFLYLSNQPDARDPQIAKLSEPNASLSPDSRPNSIAPKKSTKTLHLPDLKPESTTSVARKSSAMNTAKRKMGWEVERLSGAPKVGAEHILVKGKLEEGEWLETDNLSGAKLKVAEIGFVDVAPNSRIKLIRTKQSEHRINLARGKMSAFIIAPPRLFVVETPSATAVDLGCAYTLEVDQRGNSVLQVTSGWVSLVLDGHESIIPAGARCLTKKGVGIGTPHLDDATSSFKDALERLDFFPQSQISYALDTVLAEARSQDALSLWNLLIRGYKNKQIKIRGRIFDRLAQLAPPPKDVTRAGIVAGDRKMLDSWFEYRIR